MPHSVWAEIDLAAVRSNIHEIRAHVGLRTDVMAVVKANAYGHGMNEVARAAIAAGVNWLGVATVAEALDLRRVFPDIAVCTLAPFDRGDAEAIVSARITPLVGDLEGARALALAAQRVRGGARVHIEVDTGLGRSGVAPEGAARLAGLIARMPAIQITGMATHFPDCEGDAAGTRRQLAAFLQATRDVGSAHEPIKPLHCASSGAIVQFPETHLDLVRPGLLTYGIMPSGVSAATSLAVRPALALKSRIVLLRRLPAGHAVGYGGTHVLARSSLVATVSVGYGDGYPRALGNRGFVLIDGQRAPVIGRVNMDVITVDVSDIPKAEVGSDVALIGRQGQDGITVNDVARWSDTIPHEVTTRLMPRTPRVYLNVQS